MVLYVGIIEAKVHQDASAMGKKVHKVDLRDAEAPLSGEKLKLAMVGSYLTARTWHQHWYDLLELLKQLKYMAHQTQLRA